MTDRPIATAYVNGERHITVPAGQSRTVLVSSEREFGPLLPGEEEGLPWKVGQNSQISLPPLELQRVFGLNSPFLINLSLALEVTYRSGDSDRKRLIPIDHALTIESTRRNLSKRSAKVGAFAGDMHRIPVSWALVLLAYVGPAPEGFYVDLCLDYRVKCYTREYALVRRERKNYVLENPTTKWGKELVTYRGARGRKRTRAVPVELKYELPREVYERFEHVGALISNGDHPGPDGGITRDPNAGTQVLLQGREDYPVILRNVEITFGAATTSHYDESGSLLDNSSWFVLYIVKRRREGSPPELIELYDHRIDLLGFPSASNYKKIRAKRAKPKEGERMQDILRKRYVMDPNDQLVLRWNFAPTSLAMLSIRVYKNRDQVELLEVGLD